MLIRSITYKLLTTLSILMSLIGWAKAIPSLYFSNLTIEQGLPSNVTNSIAQDKHGFIWIGTQEGLCRYDGSEIKTFQYSGNNHSIPSNNISALVYDDNLIWVGTWDGLCTIDIHTFEVTQINLANKRTIRALYKDDKGNIWIGTANGLLKHNPEKNIYTYFDSANSGLSHNTIRSFHQSRNGDLWIGTYDGLNRYQDGEITSFNIKGDYKPLLENNLIVSISEYAKGCDSLLWVGTETGLALFNTNTTLFKHYNTSNTDFSNEVIKTIYHQNDSLLWLGTDFGLNLFNIKNESVTAFFHDPLINNTIANNVVWEIFEDKQKRIWLITSGGVSLADNAEAYYHLHEEFFSVNEPRIGNQIRDILTDKSENVWLATIHGVVQKNLQTGTKTTFSTTSTLETRVLLDNVYSLEEDHLGRIWMGTAGGINIWDVRKKQMHAITAGKENGLTSNYISSLIQAPDKSIWVSAWEGGVYRTEVGKRSPAEYQFTMTDKDGGGQLIICNDRVYYGNSNQLWVFDSKTFEKHPVNEVNYLIENNSLTIIRADEKNNLWVGAEDQLIQFSPETGKVATFTVNISSPQKIINLEQDRKGNIWGTTQSSIFQLDPTTGKTINIPVNKESPFKGFYSNCSAITKNGNILFGGDNAFLEIDPQHIGYPSTKPSVLISGIRINNQPVEPNHSTKILTTDIAFTEGLTLKHHQNSLTFEFSTLDYLYPDKGQFKYRLRPAQKNWIFSSGKKNYAVFANVRPGQYTLEVQGTNHLGIWSQTRALNIDIAPSIWLSTGFLCLYIILIIGLTYFIFRIYSYRQRLNSELEIVKIEKQHSEALYQAKIRFFTNISHEFRTPLGLIISPLKQLSQVDIRDHRFRKMIELAHRNAGRLNKLINQLLDFRKIESSQLQLVTQPVEINSFIREIYSSFDDLAQRHTIDYQFKACQQSIFCLLDREKVEAILFNLLSNAFKHTIEGGTINVNLEINNYLNNTSTIALSVQDNGPGIPESDRDHVFELFYQTEEKNSVHRGSGIGLTLAMEYAQLHGGTIKLDSEPDNGSKFTLLLPLLDATTPGMKNKDPEKHSIKEEIRKATAPEPPMNAPKILIVDDNTDFLDYLKINLENEYELLFAEEGATALNLAGAEHPDLIVSDVMMPVMDGMDLCKQIKTNNATAHIPVILLTAKTLDIDKTEGMNKGADMYITKPFDIEFLKSSIHSLFRREEQMTSYIKTRLLLSPVEEEKTEHPDELFLRKVMAIIERNIANPSFSVEIISETVGMSTTHLYRRLKAVTGQSTRDILNNYRMQKAAQMLANKEGNITEVMYAVGFSSLSSFSKSFKAKFGVSPKGYDR
jgi:signal transduction histidine kinase/ligand-binding sensor domain-containing protein/AraC-like DNA-binding protein